MLVHDGGELNLAEVRIRPLDESRPPDEQIAQWQLEQRHEELAPVRRVLQADGPQVDLITGAVVNDPFSIDSVVKLLKMTRRNVDFLLQPRRAV